MPIRREIGARVGSFLAALVPLAWSTTWEVTGLAAIPGCTLLLRPFSQDDRTDTPL